MRKRVKNLLWRAKNLLRRARRRIPESLIPTRDDLLFMAEWPALRLAAALLPERAWFGFAMRVERAKVLLGLRDPKAGSEHIWRALSLSDPAEAEKIVYRVVATSTEHLIHVLKSNAGGWNPEIQIEGRAHLDAALAQGRGAILWQSSCFSLVTKKGLQAAGYPLIHTGLPAHGFSHSPFGVRFLNPSLLRAENRYLRQRIFIDSQNPGAALLRVRRELANNGVVNFTMGAWAGRTVIRAPLLGGWLPLAVGAPGLAHRTGAALLPVFTMRMPGSHAIVIRIGEPLPTGAADSATAINDSVAALVAQLEAAIRSAPDQWTSWSCLSFDEPPVSECAPMSEQAPTASEQAVAVGSSGS